MPGGRRCAAAAEIRQCFGAARAADKHVRRVLTSARKLSRPPPRWPGMKGTSATHTLRATAAVSGRPAAGWCRGRGCTTHEPIAIETGKACARRANVGGGGSRPRPAEHGGAVGGPSSRKEHAKIRLEAPWADLPICHGFL